MRRTPRRRELSDGAKLLIGFGAVLIGVVFIHYYQTGRLFEFQIDKEIERSERAAHDAFAKKQEQKRLAAVELERSCQAAVEHVGAPEIAVANLTEKKLDQILGHFDAQCPSTGLNFPTVTPVPPGYISNLIKSVWPCGVELDEVVTHGHRETYSLMATSPFSGTLYGVHIGDAAKRVLTLGPKRKKPNGSWYVELEAPWRLEWETDDSNNLSGTITGIGLVNRQFSIVPGSE
jgi:hypothetical protein